MTARPDVAERNRARRYPWPPSCDRCGRTRTPKAGGGYGGALGLCDACYARKRRAAQHA